MCEVKQRDLLVATKPQTGAFRACALYWGLLSHRRPSASKSSTTDFLPLDSYVLSRPHLSSFCIVERSSSQLKISSLPALEGAGLFHQHPLFYDSLQNKEGRGVKHTFHRRFRCSPAIHPHPEGLEFETNNLSALCWKCLTNSFNVNE